MKGVSEKRFVEKNKEREADFENDLTKRWQWNMVNTKKIKITTGTGSLYDQYQYWQTLKYVLNVGVLLHMNLPN